MNKKAQARELTLRELIIVFGFLEGLWLAVGVNPEAEIIKAFTGVLADLEVGAGYIIFLNILLLRETVSKLLFISSGTASVRPRKRNPPGLTA